MLLDRGYLSPVAEKQDLVHHYGPQIVESYSNHLGTAPNNIDDVGGEKDSKVEPSRYAMRVGHAQTQKTLLELLLIYMRLRLLWIRLLRVETRP